MLRHSIVIFVAALFIGSTARAEESKRLTVQQAILIYNGLIQLDGYDDVCRDGATEKTCRRIYKFGGGARISIATNLAEAKRIVTAYTDARNALIAQYANGSNKVPDEDIARFNADDRKALNATVDVVFGRIKRDDLKLDENPIPPSVLSLIIPIID